MLLLEGSRIKIAVNEKEKFIVKIKMEKLTPFIVQVFADDGKKYTLRYNTGKSDEVELSHNMESRV